MMVGKCSTRSAGNNAKFPGLLRLQQIYQALTPGNEPFQVKTVRRINNVTDALQFLRGLEEQSRWEYKHVVLDCSADMAKDIVVGHVREISLGRRTYHYLLSGLVRLWAPDSNFQVEITISCRWWTIDGSQRWWSLAPSTSRAFASWTLPEKTCATSWKGTLPTNRGYNVKPLFWTRWKRLDPIQSQGAGRETISAQAALMYDAVFVLVEAFNKILRKKPDNFKNIRIGRGQLFYNNGSKILDCNPNGGWVTPWEHGDKISRYLRKVRALLEFPAWWRLEISGRTRGPDGGDPVYGRGSKTQLHPPHCGNDREQRDGQSGGMDWWGRF